MADRSWHRRFGSGADEGQGQRHDLRSKGSDEKLLSLMMFNVDVVNDDHDGDADCDDGVDAVVVVVVDDDDDDDDDADDGGVNLLQPNTGSESREKKASCSGNLFLLVCYLLRLSLYRSCCSFLQLIGFIPHGFQF